MVSFNDMSLKKKLVFNFVTVMLLSAAPLGLSFWGLSNVGRTIDVDLAANADTLQTGARLHRNLWELRTQEKALQLADTAEETQAALARIAAVRVEAGDRTKSLESLEATAVSSGALKTYVSDFETYLHSLDRLIVLVGEGKAEEARNYSVTVGKKDGETVARSAAAYADIQEQEAEDARKGVDQDVTRIISGGLLVVGLTILIGLILATVTARGIVAGVQRVISVTESIARGKLDNAVDDKRTDEIGAIATAVGNMQSAILDARNEAKDLDWLKSGVARLNDLVLGENDPKSLASSVVTEVAGYIDAKVGALYVLDAGGETPVLSLLGTYAYTSRKNLSSRFHVGEGLVGQAALERKQILIQNAPEDYIRVVSGLGEAVPRNICVTPFLFDGSVRGVLELATLKPLSKVELEYIEQIATVIATAFEIVRAQALLIVQQEELRTSNEELKAQAAALERSQEELRAQQHELQNANVELETQMLRVRESEERLRAQQEELEVTNEELKEKNDLLERQKAEIEHARSNLVVQSEELSLASKYKSEFLANMSHELRTPLNSLLLLARSLRDNGEGNLSEDQIESARVIFDSGSDLLNLINEILDLSKIEAGRMELRLETIEFADLTRSLSSQFAHMAASQGLTFDVTVADGLPRTITSDPQRLGQVIKNLVGNALKFTENGGVNVRFAPPAPEVDLSRSRLAPSLSLAIHVVDTGIGIPLDKQKVIFEAFQQADSGDRRRYGGTGLGLSISRELARLLGGEIQLQSETGKGSTFTIYIPLEKAAVSKEGVAAAPLPFAPGPKPASALQRAPSVRAPVAAGAPRTPTAPSSKHTIDDDRDSVGDSDRAVLVIEDDERFARILVNHVRKRSFKSLVALTGEEGIELARSFRPDGVVLDIGLPDMDGWSVLEALKADVDTRHIPVHIVSASDPSPAGLRIGAIGHACKPLQQEDIESVLQSLERASSGADKLVLVVEDDVAVRRETVRIIGNGNVKVEEVGTGGQALEALRARRYDLIVLDLGLPDLPGLELLEICTSEKIALPPVIIYTVRELTQDEELALRHYADSIILKDVRSQERLIDEVALFLHRVVSDLPEEKRSAIRHLHQTDEPLRGKKVLIVEDDMRTMFAMSRLLAEHGVNPVKAENGEKALELLSSQPDVDMVLMDMMMPVMDGYEATRRIREQPRFHKLPVLALTAKAMKEDRQKCLDAGASDYLAKPVDPERLVSLMRVWLSR